MNLDEQLAKMKETTKKLEAPEELDELVLTALALKALAAHKVVNKIKKGYNNLANNTNQSNPA